MPKQKISRQDINKILIIRMSSIGDIILTTPLIRLVRKNFPNAQIDFLVKKQFQSIIYSNPHIDNFIIFDKNEGLEKCKTTIKQTGYDWVIDIHNNIRSNILKRSAKAKLCTTYNKQILPRFFMINFKWNFYPEAKLVVNRYFEALAPFGIEKDEKGTEVPVPETDMQEVRSILQHKGWDGQQAIYCLCPAASYTNKQWPPEHFASIGKYLANEKNGFVVLLGGPADKELCTQIAEQVSRTAISLAGDLKLLGSAALLQLSELAIANDSGMMHLAQAQKTPVVALYGPTTYHLGYFPLPEKSEVVQLELPCRPCTQKGMNKCPKGHFKCLKNISDQMVIEAINKLCPEK